MKLLLIFLGFILATVLILASVVIIPAIAIPVVFYYCYDRSYQYKEKKYKITAEKVNKFDFMGAFNSVKNMAGAAK